MKAIIHIIDDIYQNHTNIMILTKYDFGEYSKSSVVWLSRAQMYFT